MKKWYIYILSVSLLTLTLFGYFVIKNPIREAYISSPPVYNTTNPLEWINSGAPPVNNPGSDSQVVSADEIVSTLFTHRNITFQERQPLYGTIKEVWLDGAKGEGEKDMEYYFDNWFNLIHQLQPGAVIFSAAGPDVRWVGDEGGYASTTCWSPFNRSNAAKVRELFEYFNVFFRYQTWFRTLGRMPKPAGPNGNIAFSSDTGITYREWAPGAKLFKDVRFRRTSSYSDADVSETTSFSEMFKSNAKKVAPFPDAATALESADGQRGKTVKKKRGRG